MWLSFEVCSTAESAVTESQPKRKDRLKCMETFVFLVIISSTVPLLPHYQLLPPSPISQLHACARQISYLIAPQGRSTVVPVVVGGVLSLISERETNLVILLGTFNFLAPVLAPVSSVPHSYIAFHQAKWFSCFSLFYYWKIILLDHLSKSCSELLVVWINASLLLYIWEHTVPSCL